MRKILIFLKTLFTVHSEMQKLRSENESILRRLNKQGETINEMSKFFSGHVDYHLRGRSMLIISFTNNKGEQESRITTLEGNMCIRDIIEVERICKGMVHRDNFYLDVPPSLLSERNHYLRATRGYGRKR